MKKIGSIFILLWALFRFCFHGFSYEDCEYCSLFYYVGNDLGIIGFLLLTLNQKITFLSKLRSKKLFIVLLIYSSWCLIVDVLLELGIGTHDKAIFSQIDMAILGIGVLWSFVKCCSRK